MNKRQVASALKARPTVEVLRHFFEDWDFRQEKATGVPRWMLGPMSTVPIFLPLSKKPERKESL
ncbi:hypothetical protein D3C83_176130 [compost metagenome]